MKVIISGASGGLGLALARHYLECGAIVAAFARRGDPWQMGLAGYALRLSPRWLYDRLFAHAPRKPRNII